MYSVKIIVNIIGQWSQNNIALLKMLTIFYNCRQVNSSLIHNWSLQIQIIILP